MNFRTIPGGIDKLAVMAAANAHEPAGDLPLLERPAAAPDLPAGAAAVMSCIAEVATPTGRMPVLRAMVTTACEKGCFYCPFRAGRGRMRRVTFQPDELAGAFDALQRAGLVQGIFLSSGVVNGGVRTQDRLIDTIEIIRGRYAYQGYVHLKIMPGAEYDQVVRAMQLADRVSINLEGATADRLRRLAPGKVFDDDLLRMLRWTHQIRQAARGGPPGAIRAGVVTQFVVGAVGDTDLELLAITERLHRQAGLRRAYFSRFEPVEQTPFENLPAVPAVRERRLYEASFLLRDYGWEVEDLPFVDQGNLRLDRDPKRVWADEHLREAPVDVMVAGRRDLLRVPGIGPRGADAILRARRRGRLTDLAHLRRIGVAAVERAAPYILLDGRRPYVQLPLLPD